MTSRKYHVDPKTGNMGVCHAEKGNCPFGGEDGTANHYGSEAEAQAVSEFIHAQASRRKTIRKPRKTKAQIEEERKEIECLEWEATKAEAKARFNREEPETLEAIATFRQDLDPSSGFMRGLNTKAESHLTNLINLNKRKIEDSRKAFETSTQELKDLTRRIVDEMEEADPLAMERKSAYDAMRSHPEMFMSMMEIGDDERFKDLNEAREGTKNRIDHYSREIRKADPGAYGEWRKNQINNALEQIDHMESLVKGMESMELISDEEKREILRKLDKLPDTTGSFMMQKSMNTGMWVSPETISEAFDDVPSKASRHLRYLNYYRNLQSRATPLLKSEDGKVLYRLDTFHYHVATQKGTVSIDYAIADLNTGEVTDQATIYDLSLNDYQKTPDGEPMENWVLNYPWEGDTHSNVPELESIMSGTPIEGIQKGLQHQRDMISWAHGEEALTGWVQYHDRRFHPNLVPDDEIDRKTALIKNYRDTLLDEMY